VSVRDRTLKLEAFWPALSISPLPWRTDPPSWKSRVVTTGIIEYQLTFTVVPDIADVFNKDIREQLEKFRNVMS